jgi:hypothetical protein
MVVDNTVQWLQLNLKETGLPVGFEYFTMNPNIPAGSLPLQGGLYSRLVYPDLWEWVQKQAGYLKAESEWQELAVSNGGNVPFYSKGDGSSTFRVPALKCWVKGASSISEVGDYLTAGLPDHTHQTPYGKNDSVDFHVEGNDSPHIATQEKYSEIKGYSLASTKASQENPIYSSSDTVQPPSIVGLWCVKAYGTVTNVGSTDVANISTGLTQAETRISALENHGAGATVVESYRNGTEWYRVWSDGWVEQGGSATYEGLSGTTITFFHPFSDTNFYMSMPDYGGGSESVYYNHTSIRNKAATNCKIYAGCIESISIQWYACGQGA